MELFPESSPEIEEDAAYEEVVVVKKRGRGRPKKIKEEELESEGTTGFPLGLERGKAFSSQGILNRLEKSEKVTQNTRKAREFQTNII